MMMPKAWGCFMIAGAVALAGLIAGATSGMRGEQPAPAAMEAMARFDDRWEDPELAALKKQDRLAVATPGPVPIRTERVLVEEAVEETMAASRSVRRGGATASVRRHAVVEESANVCTRHRMHKVWVSSKRWRCRK